MTAGESARGDVVQFDGIRRRELHAGHRLLPGPHPHVEEQRDLKRVGYDDLVYRRVRTGLGRRAVGGGRLAIAVSKVCEIEGIGPGLSTLFELNIPLYERDGSMRPPQPDISIGYFLR